NSPRVVFHRVPGDVPDWHAACRRLNAADKGVDFSMRQENPISRPNLLSLFDDFNRYRGDVAIVRRRGYRRESWTYVKLATIAYGVAHDLQQRGVRSGDCVLLWGANSAEWIAAFWGCLLRGAVVVPIDDGATL